MKLNELRDLVVTSSRVAAITDLLRKKTVHSIALDGLVGSSVTLLLSRLPKDNQPYIVVGNDLDEAGYLYNDLLQIAGEEAVLLFPSGYKRDIKYGQEDAPSQILRAEVLSRWGDGKVQWVVTYPEALAEKVASRNRVAAQTIQFTTGGTADMVETEKKLREYGFTEVDYVYEPGQFSVRGSILDIFSFSNEMPFRIDFFGDEIDSIRTFNIETQLSEERLDSICVVNNLSGRTADAMSLLNFAGEGVTLITHDRDWLFTRINAIAAEKISQSALLAKECDVNAMKNVVDPVSFIETAKTLKNINFAITNTGDFDARLTFSTSPQGVLHKNFDLISQLFTDYEAQGYKIYILSDNEPQFDRLRAIFEERGDKIAFTPVLKTVHEGFVDNDLKI